MEHIAIKIYGEVQGIFFRFSAKRKADEFGIKGFVKNESDGSVYIEAEGEKRAIEKFIEWCRKGPLLAQVKNIDLEMKPKPAGFSVFEIL